ncbi:MAG: hypothetical protein Q9203_005187 [Teloschistes exilis]
MTTGNPLTPSGRQPFNHIALVTPQNMASPPSKRDLTSWWKNFKKNTKKEEEKAATAAPLSGIFGVPLQESIKYANVAISLTNEHGESYIYGYVPIVVAKCGVFLKEKGRSIAGTVICLDKSANFASATDVEGIFRLSGSNKRIKELQTVFDSPDRYGKGLDWTGYTVHDAANILRRYFNCLPQPIVPLEFYEKFRDPLRSHQAQAVGTGEQEVTVQGTGDFNHAAAIATYQKLITELPSLNRQLLLYILDLLAVFSSKSDMNRMTSANLSAIFQPGLLTHPDHNLEPKAYRLSQDVLIFLIENQDSFLVGMSGTAADEKTVKEVQSGAQTRQPNSPMTPQSGMGRSSSNASAGADSLRKFGGIRRNVSVSSKGSKTSNIMPSPAGSTPGSPLTVGSGVHRSNTVPSKKSPSIPSRFSRPLGITDSADSPSTLNNYLAAGSRSLSPGIPHGGGIEIRAPSTTSSITPTAGTPAVSETAKDPKTEATEERGHLKLEGLSLQPPTPAFAKADSGTPTKERKLTSMFSKSPTSDSERKDGRQPNKLKKKRPDDANPSAQSSTHSLHGLPDSPAGQAFFTPLPTPGASSQFMADPMAATPIQHPPLLHNTSATPTSEVPPNNERARDVSHSTSQLRSPALQPTKSPAPSVHSRTSATDVTSQSEAEHLEDSATMDKKKEKKHRWRFSSSAKKTGDYPIPATKPSENASSAIAERSTLSVASVGQSSKQVLPTTTDIPEKSTEATLPAPAAAAPSVPVSSAETTPSKDRATEPQHHREREKETSPEAGGAEKRGPIGWIKGKVAKVKEDRKEREAEKERAKSPPPPARGGGSVVGEGSSTGRSGSKQSLGAIANEIVGGGAGGGERGRSSTDWRREGGGVGSGAVTASTVRVDGEGVNANVGEEGRGALLATTAPPASAGAAGAAITTAPSPATGS